MSEVITRREVRIAASPFFKDGVFHNVEETQVMSPGQMLGVAKAFFSEREGPTRPPAQLPSVAVTRESFSAPPVDDVRVCWLGHSTALLELEGVRVLTDPIWTDRSSPSQVMGPRRFQPVPLALEQLPELDAVVLSHDHYDHLDRQAVTAIAVQQPEVPFFAPLGVGAHLERWGISPARVTELDWWEEATVAHLRLVAAPARHFSGRGVLDRFKTQWASWALLGRAHRVYFGGDSGYGTSFAEIGKRFGPFDLTLLEIGAFHPSWGLIHLGPENALRAHEELGGKRLLPIHWGTFDLALHAWDHPIVTLAEKAKTAKLLVPRLGALTTLTDVPALEAWWSAVG